MKNEKTEDRYYCRTCETWFDNNIDGCPECGSTRIIDTGEIENE